ncbi:hypothetical protein GCM10022247_56790 [Allokutzneria multivorans]|uniref:Uncharacterized protein n=1 Tax=Allokutzneria multivorans TaxID=1142134 RepID=A0ABP7TEZ8_9PSEU
MTIIEDAAVEVLLNADRNLSLSGYTSILTEIRLALEEVDRLAIPTRSPRLDWAVQSLSGSQKLRIILAPQEIPSHRPPNTIALASNGFVAGIGELHQEPAIPPLFSARTVERVQKVGDHMVKERLRDIKLTQLGRCQMNAIIDTQTVDKAKQAVRPAQRAWGSVTGKVEVLVARNEQHPKAQIVVEGTRRAVDIRGNAEHRDALRDAWGRRVMAGGELTRNSLGQPVRLSLTELHVLPEKDSSLTAWDILGMAPSATGELTTTQYMDLLRRD